MAAPTIISDSLGVLADPVSSPWATPLTVPTHSSGDLLIAILADTRSGGARTVTGVPSGWTLIDSIIGTFTLASNLYAYYRIAGSSEPSTYDWLWSFQTNSAYGGIISISGAENPATTAIVTATSEPTSSGGISTSPAVTPTDADSLILRAIKGSRNSDLTQPSGETLLDEYNTAETGAVSYFTHGASSTGTANWSYTPTWHGDMVHLVTAIAPTSGGGGGGSPWYYYAQL